MNQLTRITTTTLIAASAGFAAPAAAQGALVFGAGGGGVSSQKSDAILPGTQWPTEDMPVSEETARTNLEIYADRESIAQLAEFIGAGPSDLNLILAGNPDEWLDALRATSADHFSPRVVHPKGFRVGTSGKSAGGVSKSAASNAGAGGIGDIEPRPDNRASYIPNLWPSIEVNGEFLAQIPYSFSDDMVAAWSNRGATEDPTELNAIAGVASTLATMLIIEQVAPVQFVGYNPVQHPTNGILLIANAADADFDPTTPLGQNTVSRIGRANTVNEDDEPTTLTHETWSNFPSIVRSLGFVIGLDWEQRRADAEDYIIVQPQNLPPVGFPQLNVFLDGDLGPGQPGVVNTFSTGDDDGTLTGPLLFEQNVMPTTIFDGQSCSPELPGVSITFDFNSMMLIDPFALFASLPSYIIRDEYRYYDIDGNGFTNRTPFGPDDRMVSEAPPVFFSDCDLAAMREMYSGGPTWSYGQDPNCPHDINGDGIQSAEDLRLFIELWEAGHPAADLVSIFDGQTGPDGLVTLEDLQAFSLGNQDQNLEPFTPGYCNDIGLPGPGFRPGFNNGGPG